jgi:hypothetical protein
MTDPIIRLETTQLSVEPGGQGRSLVTVRNLGNIVEGFRLEVLGEGVSEWASVTPAEVQVYPEQEATAVVVFAPPAGNTTRSGTFPFAVRAESVVDPDTSAVAEGDLEIGRVFGLQTKITPVSSSGRWRGKHFLEITNWGNAPVQLKLTATDPDEKLAFLVGPEIMDLPIGVTGHAQLRVRTLKPFLRGTQVRLPFQVVAEPDPPEVPTGPPSMIPNPRRATFDAAFVQRPILSKWVVILAGLLILGIVALVVWLLTRPAEEAGGLVQGKPTTPTLSAVSQDSTSVQLLWDPQPNITNYRILQLTDDGKTSNVITVDGGLDTSIVSELQPETSYCFRLEAVRGDQVSPQSPQQCATTAVAPPASVSASPSAEATASSASAEPSGSATADPTAGSAQSGSAGGPTGGVIVPPGGGDGNGGGGTGGAASTAATAPGGGGATSPGGAATGTGAAGAGSFTPSQYVNVIFTIPAADSESAGRAEGIRQQFVAAGIPALVLRSKDYPQLQLTAGNTPVDSYLVYIGPFGSLADAQARCSAAPSVGQTCIPVRPNPGG